jgi:hypothetical protein
MRAFPLIEPLEDRIAPASAIPVTLSNNNQTATYKDAYGDTITVTTTKGAFAKSEFLGTASGSGYQLTELNLANLAAFEGANITFGITPVTGGTNVVNVGFINASGVDLGAVTLPGDLGAIDAGGGASSTGLGALNAQSIGVLTNTQTGLTPTYTSNIIGTLGSLSVTGNVQGEIIMANYHAQAATGNITKLSIGGALTGDTAGDASTGIIEFTGTLGSATIGNIYGTSGNNTGQIIGPSIGTLNVLGSIVGGSGTNSGSVFFTGTVTTAVIGGGIEGGSGNDSGSILGFSPVSNGEGVLGSASSIGSISVNGKTPNQPSHSILPDNSSSSILGGGGVQSGAIAAMNFGAVSVANDIIGNSGNVSGTIEAAGYPTAATGGNINQLTIGGSLVGYSGQDSGGVFFTGTLGTAVIAGGIEGGSGSYSGVVFGSTLLNTYDGLSQINSISVNGNSPYQPNPTLPSGTLGASIAGGSGFSSGGIAAVNIGTVSIAGDVFGQTGDGSAFIQAGNNLQTVTIGGSLIGGDFTPGSPTQAEQAGIIYSENIGTVTIGSNIYGGSGLASGEVYAVGTLQSITVMGNLVGGSAGNSGTSGYAGAIFGDVLGTVTIKGSVIGGNAVSGDANQLGSYGGSISSITTIGAVNIGVQLLGGSGDHSGFVQSDTGGVAGSGSVGTISIGAPGATSVRSIQGGSGQYSGSLDIGGAVQTLTLTGTLRGGSATNSGSISVGGNLNTLQIGANVTGGSASSTGMIAVDGTLSNATISGTINGTSAGSTQLADTGYIQAGSIGTLDLVGALNAGGGAQSTLASCGAIRSESTIGSLTIGSIQGTAADPAVISAEGLTDQPITATSDLAIGSLTVNGNVAYADILAGYSPAATASNNLGTGMSADAQIGSITIAGTMGSTNIIAGVGAGSQGFGTKTSASLGGSGVSNLPSVISSISSIIVKGGIVTETNDTHTYGIAAQQIGSASFGGVAVSLIAGADNDTFALGKDHPLPGNSKEVLYEV